MVTSPVSRLLSAAFLAGALFSLPGQPVASAAEPVTVPNLSAQVDSAIARVRPALVRIRVVAAEYSEGRELKLQEVGSGAIISKDGYLITNHHVAGHGKRLFCTLWNREEIEAELIGTDALTDISVLKLKPETPREFAFASFGDSLALRVGDNVLAMGSPMALSQSVTLGIVSNTEMVMPRFFGPAANFKLDGEDVGSLVRWIAHDAAIYGGNSGGPLVNLAGEIVGINEISFGLSGAIPGNLARRTAEEIRATGKVTRSWVGMDVQPLLKHTKERGVLISGVLKDSPADKAGIKAGDLLIRLGDIETEVRYDEQMPEFMRQITSLPMDREVPAIINRAGVELNVRLLPTVRGELNPKEQELKQWGLTVRDLSMLMAREMKRTNTAGVLVTSVRPGGPAGDAKPPFNARDVIVEVAGKPVKSLQELSEVTRLLTQGKGDAVPLVVAFERGADRFLTVAKLGLPETRDPGLETAKAWLPVQTHVISRELAKQLGRPELKGYYITRVFADSTAEKAGLKPGDFLIAFDGDKLTATGPEHEDDLSDLVRQYDIGKNVELVVLRGETEVKLSVELARAPRLQREMKKYRNDDFEFSARDISFLDTADMQLKRDQQGILVEDVKSGGWAELGTLYAGDLIIEVENQPTNEVDGLKKILEQIAAQKKSVVVMKVLRGIHTRYLELEPDWKN